MTIYQIPLEKIVANPWQTRQGTADAETIKELALDIAANGLLQTPIGRILLDEKPVGTVQLEAYGGAAAYLQDMYPAAALQLAFGHNRLAAYKWLFDLRDNSDIQGDWSRMPVDVRALSDLQMAGFAWSENEKRRDVTAIERAKAIQMRLDSFKWTNRQCAEALGVDHSTISNLLRLLKLPEDMQQAILEGKVSERQAMAILPVFEAPDTNTGSNFGSYGYSTNSNGIKQAALNGVSSDELRRKVDSYFSYRSKDLAQAEFKLDQLFPEGEGIYCGLCKTCDRRFASRNRCFDAVCFVSKTNHLHREYLKKASKATGYPPIDEHKGGYTSGLPSNPEEFEKILSTHCPNLALQYTQGETKHSIEGHPHAMLVCDKRNDSCTCVKGMRVMGLQEHEKHEATAKDSKVVEDGSHAGLTPQVLPPQVLPQPAAPIGAGDLEEAARQARRAKAEVGKQLPAFRKRLEEHMYHQAAMNRPGVYYAAVLHYGWAKENDVASMENIYRLVAYKAAGVVMPLSVESMGDLHKRVGVALKRLSLDAMDIQAEEANGKDIEFVKEL
jgi:ParB/RepB/Spo0J family partition protein